MSSVHVPVPVASGRRPLLVLALCAAVVGVAGGLVVRVLHDRSAAPALPELHGQGVWAAGRRPAPAFALRDQHGALVSLAALRGRPVVLTFLDSRCTSECPIAGRELGSIMRRLPAASRPALVVVSVDPKGDTPPSIAHALAKWHLTGAWTVHWLNAPTRAAVARVWRAYHVQVEATTNDIVHSLALYLIDRRGDERTAYLFPFLQSFVQTDLARLAAERT
ncbi:MAG TPA: SCO family protein [Gaiellaceae bacterium]|nr:SCO family protein [Gaiellaceae bacterium]